MSRFDVSESGIEKLRSMSYEIREAAEDINEALSRLRAEATDRMYSLGPHGEAILDVTEDIMKINRESYEEIEYFSEYLERIAEVYESILCDSSIISD